ncbi:MAG: flotillin-like protein FloA [Kiritimatiellaeota bacterium]|nr:flotillin-like protein FloA [Kiritimatiellota bacterium]
MFGQVGLVLLIVMAIPILILLGTIFYFLKIWIQALTSGARVSFFTLVAMKLRRVPPSLIVEARIRLVKAGIGLGTDPLEAHYLAGGDVIQVVNAMIAADKAGIPLIFQNACAINLAGRDVHAAVQTSVNPKVIDCPDPARGTTLLDAVAKDGIRLLVKARVTVRTNLKQLVGGAMEDTIIARVGQGIVSAIGSSHSYKDVLENPDKISRKVLESGLDSQTAFEIVSIDIADVSVAGVSGAREVANVGALLETERAEADKKLRQAEAEGRRAMAVAAEQEMRAKTQEMQAKLVEAQAQIPLGIAQALKEGRIGVMDYLKMQNVMADTSMRESLSGGEDQPKA